MRKGCRKRDWTAEELSWLSEHAGKLPLQAIADHLGRTRGAVKQAARRGGLSLRCGMPQLAWCPRCATWRSSVVPEGTCRVCREQDKLDGRRAACERTLPAMSPVQRSRYEAAERWRGPRKQESRPKPTVPPTSPVAMRSRRLAQQQHLLELEEWEWRRLHRAYDAEKTRLSRMRKACGDYV